MIRTLRLLWQLTLPSLRRQPAAPAPGMRRDPAPTLWSYRYQRLMLTPAYKRMVRWGLPAFALAVAGALWIGQAENQARLAAAWDSVTSRVTDRPEFMVRALEIAGADPVLERAIDEVLALDLPASSFDLDLEAIRSEVTALTAVSDAAVRVRAGGTLEVAVTQRVPVALWRYADGLRLIDAEGVMTGMVASRTDRADLPLIAGDGAREAIGEALDLFAAAAPIGPRVRGLVRMGERRWDMVLDDDTRVLLPAEGAVPALLRVIAFDQAEDLLDRDVMVVDMRLGDRPTVRVGGPALNVLRTLATVSSDGALAPIPEEEQ